MFDLIQERETGTSLAPRTMVYVVVHGEANPDDSQSLSEVGKEQVEDLTHSRMISTTSRIYSAPEEPALETAGLLRKHFDAPVEVKDCLKTINLPDTPNQEYESKLKAFWLQEKDDGLEENLQEVADRISTCTDKTAAGHVNDSIVFVVDSIVSAVFYWLVAGGEEYVEDWLDTGYASCGTYEYSKKGWSLIMPPDNTFQREPSSVRDYLSEGLVDDLLD
ncbi:histidine phosphatase family protein [Candidatus Thorarchaeota archaeon]|nr:MAG: histidine phosphatase family protein [Candidatus Thorarchaeota archaeon]